MRRLGKYEVLGELGHGAMGVVYRARDPIINRLVALKTITTGLADDPKLLQRFYREAQSAGGLQHPNIVTIYDMGDEQNLPYIAMELIEGESLEQIIAHRTSLPIALKLTYVLQACRAFDYAHKRGIIHRDIKPGNVMVNKEGVVKVVDFGIARVLDTSKTQTGMLIGTFAYMSPEQYHGEHADERSDIWSFGVLLYELLCYQKPFAGQNPASLMHSICQQEPRRLQELVPECPAEIDIIICKLLRKSPQDRCQSMDDLLLELEPVYKELQARSIAELIDRSRRLIAEGEFAQARELLRESLKVDSANSQARTLLEKVNAELRRILIRPRVLQHVENGRALLEEGRIQEASAEVENALQLDSSFELAQELLKRVRHEFERVQIIADLLQAARQRLAEGMPEEAEELLAKVLDLDPSNRDANVFQQQVQTEKAERQRRLWLLEKMQDARGFWTQQNYEDSVEILTALQREFPGEDEIQRLLETVREDQADQSRQSTLERARNLLAGSKFAECRALLLELQQLFPNDDETAALLEDVRLDEAKQRRSRALAEARICIASSRYQGAITLLESLEREFSNDEEVSRLLKSAREDQAEQKRQQGVAEARNLLAGRRYEECNALLGKLQAQFPNDGEIPELLNAVREDQAERRKLKSLTEARNLLAAGGYDESITLLESLEREFSNDEEVSRLLKSAREDQAEQKRQQGVAEARNLLAGRRYEECNALLGKLQEQFPNDGEIPELLNAVREDQAEQRKLKSLTEARDLLAAGGYDESVTLLESLEREFSNDEEVSRLLKSAREDQAEQKRQQGVAEARNLLAGRRYEECNALLGKLQEQFPNDGEIPELLNAVREDQAERRKLKSLTEARNLLAAGGYDESVTLLESLEREFSNDEEVSRLLKSAREDQAEQKRQQGVAEARNLLAGRRYEECNALLGKLQAQFPNDGEIPELLNAVREDQAERRKLKSLTEARNLLAAGGYDESITLLTELRKEFPHEEEISRLLTSAREGQVERRKLNRLTEARNLLASKRYEDSITLLTYMQKEFPNEREIPRLLVNAGKEQTEQQKQQKLTEARVLLAAQRFNEALELLDTLSTIHPKNSAIQKLRVLVERERDKQTSRERLQGELESLRKLVSEKKYSDVLSCAEALQTEFPGNMDLLRLVEFARGQQSRIEIETRLRTFIDEVKAHSQAGRFTEAIGASNSALKAFPDNAELLHLLEQAKAQQKKQRTRGLMEQRIREIKFKINRENFSEAIDLAKETLATTGPDADLVQLMNSALVEVEARDKKRKQEQKLQEIRNMMESGNIDQAAETLYDALTTEVLDGFTPGVSRISEEIDAAKNGPNVASAGPVPSTPAKFSKEYAFLQGTPSEVQPLSPEKVGAAERSASQASASQPVTSPEISPTLPPQSMPVAPAPVAPPEVPSVAGQPMIESQPLALSPSTEQKTVQAEPRVATLMPPHRPAPATEGGEQVSLRTSHNFLPRDFKKVAAGALVLGLILAVWLGVHFISSSKTIETTVPPAINPSSGQGSPSAEPAVNPAEAQQRIAIEAADKLIASGDFRGALQDLQDAEKLNGPLIAEIKSKEVTIGESMRNENLARLRQEEATVWQQATNEVEKSQFDAANRDFRKILSYGDAGVRRADAQKYLEDVMPRRKKEEELFTQAKQVVQANDIQSLQKAADLSAQVQAFAGPRKTDAAELQRTAEARLSSLQHQIATLDATARQNIQQGDLSGARQKTEQIRQAGGDPTALSREIDQAQTALNILEQQEKEFQEAVQVYNGIGSRDREGLEKSRSNFQVIARENGRHSGEAQQYLAEISKKIEPLNTPLPPPSRKGSEETSTTAGDETAIRALIQGFFSAFEQKSPDALRQVWPSIPTARYEGYRRSFDQASAISMQVVSESLKINSDATATVSAQSQQRYTPKVQKAMKPVLQTWSFQLAKKNGIWLITNVQ